MEARSGSTSSDHPLAESSACRPVFAPDVPITSFADALAVPTTHARAPPFAKNCVTARPTGDADAAAVKLDVRSSTLVTCIAWPTGPVPIDPTNAATEVDAPDTAPDAPVSVT